ncbi:lysM and putative peptidoglycan-binding domain-containing protein 1 [Cyrtonyx montezumae]|uniref:lysM and putative peptidoglycan-binding domain-containing protein 1 n=1 Tax=Cyrtonyx montezumae TaxID=9017 RepID=UPI0032D9C671
MAGGREHRVGPGDTLPGLALRYGVTMEQIQRANRLYASDTIFLKPTLLIPPPQCPSEEPTGSPPSDPGGTATAAVTAAPPPRDLTVTDFLRRVDADIGRSKAAAVAQRLRTGVPDAAVALPAPGPSPRGPQLGARPLTRTRRAAALRDTEDEIFTL